MWKYWLPGYELQLLGELQRQQHTRLYCDTLLQADGVLIPAHSCILAALSPYLAQSLATSPCPRAGQIRQLQLQALNAATLRKLVGLLYSGKMEGEGASEKDEVLAAALCLGIGPLEEGCRDRGMEEGKRRRRKEAAVQTEGWGERDGRRDVGVHIETEGRKDGETEMEERRLADMGTQTVHCGETALDAVPLSTLSTSLPGTEPQSFLFSALRPARSQDLEVLRGDGLPQSPSDCQYSETPAQNSKPEEHTVSQVIETTSSIVLRSHVKKGPIFPGDHRLLLEDLTALQSSLGGTAIEETSAVPMGEEAEKREEEKGECPSAEGRNMGGEESEAKRREGGRTAMKNMVRLRQLENMETQSISFKVKLRRKNRRSLWEVVPMQEKEETLSSQNKHSLSTLSALNRPPLPPLTPVPPGQVSGPQTLTPPAEPLTSPKPPYKGQLTASASHLTPSVPQRTSFSLEASSSVTLTPDSDCQLHFPQPLSSSLPGPLPEPLPPQPPGEDSDEHLDRLLEDIMMDLNILPPMALERNCNGTHSNHHQLQRHHDGVCQDCDPTAGVEPCFCSHSYGTGSDEVWSTETASYPGAFSVPCTFPHDLHQDPQPAAFLCSHPSTPHLHHSHPTCVNPNRADCERGAPCHAGSDQCPSDSQNQSRYSRTCSANSGQLVCHASRPSHQQPHHYPSHCQAVVRSSGEGKANCWPSTSTTAFSHAERTKPNGEADPRQVATNQKCWCTVRQEPTRARSATASGLCSEALSGQKLHYPAGQGANPCEEPQLTSQNSVFQSWEDLRLPLCLSPLNADNAALKQPSLSRHPSIGFLVQHPHPRRPSWLSLTPRKLQLTLSSMVQSSQLDAHLASRSKRSLARQLDSGDATVRESAHSGWKERRIKDENLIRGKEKKGGDGGSKKKRKSQERKRRGDGESRTPAGERRTHGDTRRELSAAKKKKKSRKRKRSLSGGRSEFHSGGGMLTVKVSEATQSAVGLGLGLCSVSLSSNNILAQHRVKRQGSDALLLPGLTAAYSGALPLQRGRDGEEGSHARCPFPQGRIRTKSCSSEPEAPWEDCDPGPSETPFVHMNLARIVKTEEEEQVPPKRKRGRPRKRRPVEETPVISAPPPAPAPVPATASEHGSHDGKVEGEGHFSEHGERGTTEKEERPKRRCRKRVRVERSEDEEEGYDVEEKPPRRKRYRKRASEDFGEVLSKHNYCRLMMKGKDKEKESKAKEDSDLTPLSPDPLSQALSSLNPFPPAVIPEPFTAPCHRTGTGPEFQCPVVPQQNGHRRSITGASSSSSTSVLSATTEVFRAIQPPASPVTTAGHHKRTSKSSKDKLKPSKRLPMVTLKAFGQLLRHRHLKTRKSDENREKPLKAEAEIETEWQGDRETGGHSQGSTVYTEPSQTVTDVSTDFSTLAEKEHAPENDLLEKQAGSFKDTCEKNQHQSHVEHRGQEENQVKVPDGAHKTNNIKQEKNNDKEREQSKESRDNRKTDVDDVLEMLKAMVTVLPAADTKATEANKMDAPQHLDKQNVSREEQSSSEIEVVDWSSEDVDVGDGEDTAFQRPCFAAAEIVTAEGEEEEEVDVEVEEEEGESLSECLVDNTKTGLTEGLTDLPRESGPSTVENFNQDPLHLLNKCKMAAATVQNPHIPQNVDHLPYQSPCKVTIGAKGSCEQEEEGEVDILGCSPVKCLLLDERCLGLGISAIELVMEKEEEEVNEIDVTTDELD